MRFNEIDISVLVRLDENGKVASCKGGTLAGKTEAEPEPDGEKRLYVWHEFAPDYKHGLAVAIASSEAEARRLVVKHLGLRPDDWGPLTTYPLGETVAAWAVTGGQ